MRADIEQKQSQRLQLMRTLYESTGGSRLISVPVEDLARELALSMSEADELADYLSNEGLIEFTTGNHASITHKGVVEVEEALSNPDQSTQHFAPMNIVYVGGDIVGSQVQSGVSNSSQSQNVSLGGQRENIERFVTEFRAALDDDEFPDDVRLDTEAHLATVDAQLTLPEPNKVIVKESLRSLRAITENLAASGLFIGLVELGRQMFF